MHATSTNSHAPAVIDDLLPAAFDLLYPAVNGYLSIPQARGIVARTLVEHLNLVVVNRTKSNLRNLEKGRRAEVEELSVQTFDRFSSQYGTRSQLLERLTARLDNNALAANIAITLVEARTDLMLSVISTLQLSGVGTLTFPAQIRGSVSEFLTSRARDHDVREGRGLRSRRWYLRTFADQTLLATTNRPVVPYLLTIPSTNDSLFETLEPSSRIIADTVTLESLRSS